MASSSKGPLPTFGGPPSKANYMCKICGKKMRRDMIRKHYTTYVDLEALQETANRRGQVLARLTSERRKHTEEVMDYYDINRKLPLDYNNINFWKKVTNSADLPTIKVDFFTPKHKTQVELSFFLE